MSEFSINAQRVDPYKNFRFGSLCGTAAKVQKVVCAQINAAQRRNELECTMLWISLALQ